MPHQLSGDVNQDRSLVYHSPGPYTDWRCSQFINSHDVVLYSGLAEALLRVPWPVADDNRRIPPEVLIDWLREHDLYWPCFCVQSSGSLSCSFTIKPDGTVLALCNKTPSVCAFELNLTKIFKTTRIESKFPHLVPRGDYWVPGEFDAIMQPFLTVFESAYRYHMEVQEEDLVTDPPIFWGYCGDSDMRIEQEGAEWRENLDVTWSLILLVRSQPVPVLLPLRACRVAFQPSVTRLPFEAAFLDIPHWPKIIADSSLYTSRRSCVTLITTMVEATTALPWFEFPPELRCKSLVDMDFQSLVAMSQTSMGNCVDSKALMLNRVDRRLETFALDAPLTLTKLKECNAFISGSVALVVLFPEDGPFEPDNIDIFVESKHLPTMDAFVHSQGYTDASSLPAFNTPPNPLLQPPFAPYPRGVTSIVRRYNDSVQKRLNIYEVKVGNRAPLEIVMDFPTSLVMNAITHAGVCCAYPELTLNKIGIIKLSAVGTFTPFTIARYRTRGFRFADGWRDPRVMDIVFKEEHDCYTFRCCPRLGRWARSHKGLLWLSFELGTDITDIIPDFRWYFFPLDDLTGYYPSAGTPHPCDPHY
ncbi:hypothetical protein NMY22_g16654 [Coprinellus aureogranulatus]|nr:hypothetical protein NMY22_g16654 [Coprinellus aureogranulatus]